MKLNLGCSDRHLAGYVNVDLVEPADVCVDLDGDWPWDTSSIDEIVAHDCIEHLNDKIHTMNEAWRVLRPGGVLDVVVPEFPGPGSVKDPTHVTFWHRESFFYYTAGDQHRERFGAAYGILARFAVLSSRVDHPGGDPKLSIRLLAVK